jgi:transposase
VDHACRYEPDLNRTYQEMAAHYGVAVLPARPKKPRDKAKVENAVLLAERWVIAALRHRKFHALPELNEAIAELLEKLNQPAVPETRGLACQPVCRTGSPGIATSASRTLCAGPLEDRPRLDRLAR